VLDVDVRHGGPEALAKQLDSFGSLPKSWLATTPTGGSHFWFNPVQFKPKGKLCQGVEVLTGNRLVTVSPSARAGDRYRWIRSPLTELAHAPDWLIRAIKPRFRAGAMLALGRLICGVIVATSRAARAVA